MNAMLPFETYLRKSRFGSLDGVRFFCIAAVLFHHAPGAHELGKTYMLASRGFLGVDFFFVLSGFLITTLLLRERDATGEISLRGFYWRRALRILPLYLTVVTAMIVIFGLIKDSPEVAHLWPYYYMFLANFLVGDIPNLGPMWSLSVEEQYYVFWPLLMVLLPQRVLLPAVTLLICMVLVGVLGISGISAPSIGPLEFKMHQGYAAILLGAGAGIALHNQWLFARLYPVIGTPRAVILPLVLFAVMLLYMPGRLMGWPQFMLHLTMTWILACLVVREDHILMPILQWAPLARVGQISYGVYLLHLIGLSIALVVVETLRLPEGGAWHIVLYVVFAYALAEISFRTLERYFLSLRYKSFGSLRSVKK